MSLASATRSLAVDLVTAEVAIAMDRATVPYIVLKGPSIALWLYRSGRRYVDTDLLVPPSSWGQAEATLAALGFINLLAGAAREEQDPDACVWWRERDRASVDLHRRLRGSAVSSDQVWLALIDQTESMPIAGRPTPVLNPAARLLTLALQAAHDGVGNPQAMEDLRRAIEQVNEARWIAAVALASRLQATSAFAAGLRLIAGGPELAERLGLPVYRSTMTGLKATRRPPLAIGFATLAEIEAPAQKLRFLKQNLVPSPAFMRSWSGLAHRGPLGMTLAYGWRVIYCAWNALPGYLAWRRARRLARLHD